MIEFFSVSIQYTKDFYSLLEFSRVISSNTLFVGDFYSGTSSILRILAKIDKHYSGDVKINGENIKKIKEKNLNISYLPEIPVLFNFKSIFYNLYYPLKIRKISKKLAKNRINTIKNEYFLTFFEKNIKKLNLTEKKLICLIRAILRNPKIILLENFFENFDEKYLDTTIDLIKKIPTSTLIIACEKSVPIHDAFKNFEIIDLEKDA